MGSTRTPTLSKATSVSCIQYSAGHSHPPNVSPYWMATSQFNQTFVGSIMNRGRKPEKQERGSACFRGDDKKTTSLQLSPELYLHLRRKIPRRSQSTWGQNESPFPFIYHFLIPPYNVTTSPPVIGACLFFYNMCLIPSMSLHPPPRPVTLTPSGKA